MDKLKPLLAKMAKADRDLILFLAARVAKKARRQEPKPDIDTRLDFVPAQSAFSCQAAEVMVPVPRLHAPRTNAHHNALGHYVRGPH